MKPPLTPSIAERTPTAKPTPIKTSQMIGS